VVVGRETHLDEAGNVWVRRLGQDGSEFWTDTYVGDDSDFASGVAIGADGAIAVVGTTDTGPTTEIWIRKYTQDGGELWTQTYGIEAYNGGEGVTIDLTGRITVTGTVQDGSSTSIWVGQYDADGGLQWSDTYDSGNDNGYFQDLAGAVTSDSDGNIVVVGAAVGSDGLSWLSWIRKYSPDGDEIWTSESSIGVPMSSVYSYAQAVAIDAEQNIIVGGYEQLDGGDSDAWVRKLAP
jgi:hypothetical protein